MGSFIGGCPCIARDGRRSRRTRQRDSGWPGAGRSGPLSPSRPGVGSRGPRPPRPPRDGGPALDAAFVRAVAWRRGEDESGTRRGMNRRALCAAVLAVACSAAFGRTALHGFLFWDDRAFIAENPLIAHPSAASLLALWTTPLEDLYAPLTYTLWGLLAAVFGPKPWAFHLTNVALHALNGGLVFAVLRRLVTEDDGRAALAGALLFALHPVQSEAVAWASEAKDLLSALFSLLAIRQYLVFREGENRRAYLWASGAFACALLAKPSAVVAPVLLVILNRGIQRRDWAGSLRGLSPWFVAAAAFTLIAAHVQPAAGLHFVAPVWLRPAIALDALTFYLGKLVLPLHLIPDYGRTSQSVVSSGALAYTWIPAAALLAAGWVLRQKLPWMAAAVALFVAALLPVLGLVPFDFQYYSNVADHY